MSFKQIPIHTLGYDLLAYSAINSMNYLFLRQTFRVEQVQIIKDELQNFVTSLDAILVKKELSPVLFEDLTKCLRTELLEGSYVEDITQEQARQKYIDSIENLGCAPSEAVVNFYLSLLEEFDYAN